MLELEAMQTGRVLGIGHRGAMAYAPENTMASFQLGVELGADLIELDVHQTRDQELIVIHDGDISRTTTGRGRVKDMTLRELRDLDAGIKFAGRFRGERVPTLSDVLAWAKRRIPLVIEIKGDPQPAIGIEENLVNTLRAQDMLNEVMIISFYHPALQRIRQLEPQVATGILYSGRLGDTVSAARAVQANSVRVDWPYWEREVIRQVHQAGLTASTWDVNEEPLMEYLIELGIDSICTDYPDRLKSCLARVGCGQDESAHQIVHEMKRE